ncbi:MAG: pilus assembly protein [Chloroflexi bacterium]|nr:MAG: pilus assembly protein [Chloroflexota bacterium]
MTTIQQTHKKQKGQSLVEVALFFPIFLIVIAGLVEVSQLVITQNRISNAARVSARFAANGGEDEGIWQVALNSVTQTLEADPARWDIFAIRGQINENGNGFTEWQVNHVYGISQTAKFAEVNWTEIKNDILNELQTDQFGNQSNANAANLRFAGAYILYDTESILGLDALPNLVGFNTIRALNIMRVVGSQVEQTNGCSAFPIAVHTGVRSLTDPNGGNPYPPANEFDYPQPPPTYDEFIYNVPQVPFTQAQEGYIFKIQNGFGEGNFGWLVWNTGIAPSANTLADSLSWPGNSNDYTDHGDGGQVVPGSGFNHVVRGYIEPGDPTDQSLHVGDWVAALTGSVNSNAVRSVLQDHIDSERAVRVVVWDQAQGQGVNGQYRINGFAVVRLRGYKLSQGQGNPSWILAEFVRWDTSCGQVLP